jgi:uncharacterized protein YjbI with pentapeptide repeats
MSNCHCEERTLSGAKRCRRARRSNLMKSTMKHGIQLPRLPKSLSVETIASLEDHAEYFAASISGGEWVKQAATSVIFGQVRLQRVNFTQSRLIKLRLLDVELDTCDLTGAIWEQARWQRAVFNGCRLTGAQLLEARCEDVVFRDCTLENAIFASATFKAARFENCNLREAIFTEADLTNAVFQHCDLTHADLHGSRLGGADLRGSIIDGMQVGASELKGAIIDPAQAVQVVTLLGVTVKEQER